MAEIREATGVVRTATEGGLWASAAVVAADLASTRWPEVQGSGVLAAAVVGAGAAWLASVARNLAVSKGVPEWVKTVIGV